MEIIAFEMKTQSKVMYFMVDEVQKASPTALLGGKSNSLWETLSSVHKV